MNRKGFTIIEILGVLVLIAVLYIIFFPATIELFQRSTLLIDGVTEDIIVLQTKYYLEDNITQYPLIEDSVYCIPINNLIEGGYLGDFLYDAANYEEYNLNKIIKVEVTNQLEITIIDNYYCQVNYGTVGYIDQSGAYPPVLNHEMIPVYWNLGWVVADKSDSWYNYNEKQWANAVLVKPEYRNVYLNNSGVMVADSDILAHFVWIPRYRYKLFNTESTILSERRINIEFEHPYIDRTVGNFNSEWLTHPAFTQSNQELKGFWVGKFITTGTNAVPMILPNQEMLRSNSMSQQFDIAKLVGINDYGINVNSKIMRNTEWGAVAYFSQSKYGNSEEIWINPNNNYLTGCVYNSVDEASTNECQTYDSVNGLYGSTTGNVYGVYDMSGGVWERVLGVMNDSSNENIQELQAGFGELLLDEEFLKYFDIYQYGISASSYERRILGDATGEVHGWYNAMAQMPHGSNFSWVLRGGNYSQESNAGLYAFSTDNGNANNTGFRIVIPIY